MYTCALILITYFNHTCVCMGINRQVGMCITYIWNLKWKFFNLENSLPYNTASQLHSSIRVSQSLGLIITLSVPSQMSGSLFIFQVSIKKLVCKVKTCVVFIYTYIYTPYTLYLYLNLTICSFLFTVEGKVYQSKTKPKAIHLQYLKISTWPKATYKKYMHVCNNIS